MPRDLSTTQLSGISGKTTRIIDFIKIELAGRNIRVTNFEADVTTTGMNDVGASETFKMGLGYLYHSDITLTTQTSNQTVNITFDAVSLDSTATEEAPVVSLANSTHIGKTVTIGKHIVTDTNFGTSSTATINDVFVVFKGIIDNISFKTTDANAYCTVYASGPFANFDKTAIYGYTNTQSQRLVYPDDRGFTYSQSTLTSIKWEE